MGFEWQIREIVDDHGMPMKKERQTMMFSATFPSAVQALAGDYLYDHIWICIGVVGGAVATVEQKVEQVTAEGKFDTLIEQLDSFCDTKQEKDRMLIFCNSRSTAKWLDENLFSKNFDVGALHGELTQQQRELNLRRFRDGEIEIMIATD